MCNKWNNLSSNISYNLLFLISDVWFWKDRFHFNIFLKNDACFHITGDTLISLNCVLVKKSETGASCKIIQAETKNFEFLLLIDQFVCIGVSYALVCKIPGRKPKLLSACLLLWTKDQEIGREDIDIYVAKQSIL